MEEDGGGEHLAEPPSDRKGQARLCWRYGPPPAPAEFATETDKMLPAGGRLRTTGYVKTETSDKSPYRKSPSFSGSLVPFSGAEWLFCEAGDFRKITVPEAAVVR